MVGPALPAEGNRASGEQHCPFSRAGVREARAVAASNSCRPDGPLLRSCWPGLHEADGPGDGVGGAAVDPPVVSRTQLEGWVGFKARSEGAHSRATLQMGLQHRHPGTTPQSDPCGPSNWTGGQGPAAGLGTGSRGRGLTGDPPLPASFLAAQAPESPQSTVTWPSHLQMKILCPAQTP